MLRKKIDNNSKSGMMVGYIHQSGDVTAIEPGWNMTPLVMAKLLKDLYPNKQEAIELVDSAVLVPVFRKEEGLLKTVVIGKWDSTHRTDDFNAVLF